MIKDTNSLLELYYSVGGLLSIKVTPLNSLLVYTCLFDLLISTC